MVKWIFSFLLLLLVTSYTGKANNALISYIDTPQLNPHVHAEKILLGTVRPGDDRATFACMDSLLSENSDTQNYYFKVMKIIVSKSDGALSTMVAVMLKEYLEKSSISFLQNFKTLSMTEQKNFSWYLANEYYAEAANGQKAIKNVSNYLTQLKKHCETCKNYAKEINNLQQYISTTIKSFKDEY